MLLRFDLKGEGVNEPDAIDAFITEFIDGSVVIISVIIVCCFLVK